MQSCSPNGGRQPAQVGPALRLDSLLAAPEPAFAVEPTGRIVYWNSACERLTGVAAPEAVGRACADVVKARIPSGKLCAERCILTSRGHGAACGEAHAELLVVTTAGARQLTVQTIQLSVRPQPVLVHLLRDATAQHRVILAARRIALALNGLPPTPERSLDKPPVTPREREALAGLSEGLSTNAIATRMGISAKTASHHLENAMAKLGAHTRLEALAAARRLAIVD